MSNQIRVALTVRVPNKKGEWKEAIGYFVMEGDWIALDVRDGPFIDTHPRVIHQLDIQGPNGQMRMLINQVGDDFRIKHETEEAA